MPDNNALDEDYLDSLLNAVNEDNSKGSNENEDNSLEAEIEQNDIDMLLNDVNLEQDLNTQEDLDIPDIPEDLDIPDMPEDLDIPDMPEDLDIPDMPEDLDIPDMPEDLDIPDMSEDLDIPDMPEDLDIPDMSEDSDLPGLADLDMDSEDLFDDINTDEDLDKLLRDLEESENENDDIDKIADELNSAPGVAEASGNDTASDIPDDLTDMLSNDFGIDDLDSLDSLDDLEDKTVQPKEKKGFFSKLFGKKKKKDETTEEQNENTSTGDIDADDNDAIIKMHEEAEGKSEAFDLSEFDEFDSLDSIEDRSSDDEEKLKAQKKEEKEKKKKEKEEKKAEKKRLKEEKAERKKQAKAEKERLKAEKPKPPVEKIKITKKGCILSLSIIVAIVIGLVFGGKTFWYRKCVNDASDLLLEKKYVDAYNTLAGVVVKKDDEGLSEQLRTLVLIQREYDSYETCMTMRMPDEAISSLIKGVERYNENADKAETLGVKKDADSIFKKIVKKLSETYNITPEDASDLYKLSSEEYSAKIKSIVENNTTNIEIEYEKYKLK